VIRQSPQTCAPWRINSFSNQTFRAKLPLIALHEHAQWLQQGSMIELKTIGANWQGCQSDKFVRGTGICMQAGPEKSDSIIKPEEWPAPP
jgi:hypothetical protein